MGGGGRYSQNNWVGVYGSLPETLTLFQTNIYELFQLLHSWRNNLRRAFVDGLMAYYDEVVVTSSKKHTQFKIECTNHTLFQTKTAEKAHPLGPHNPI